MAGTKNEPEENQAATREPGAVVDAFPFDDEPPPTPEELAEARALAEAIDARDHGASGSLAEAAAKVRASLEEAPPLARSVVARGIDEGLARRRRTTRRVALGSLAAAAIAIAGFLGLELAPPDAPRPTEPEVVLPALHAPRFAPLAADDPAGARADVMARAAVADWLGAELAQARAEVSR